MRWDPILKVFLLNFVLAGLVNSARDPPFFYKTQKRTFNVHSKCTLILHFKYNLSFIMGAPLLLDGLGLELGSQFTCIVGLVFPTRGSSSPNDPMAPHSSHEFPFLFFLSYSPLRWYQLCFSFYSLFPPKIPNLHSSLNSTIYRLRLMEVSWLHSGLTRVGGVQCDYSWPRISPIRNSGNGIGTNFRLQKIAQQRYFLRQYRAAGDMGCSKWTYSQASHNGPNMGLSIMHPKMIRTYYKIWAQFWPLGNLRDKAQWA